MSSCVCYYKRINSLHVGILKKILFWLRLLNRHVNCALWNTDILTEIQVEYKRLFEDFLLCNRTIFLEIFCLPNFRLNVSCLANIFRAGALTMFTFKKSDYFVELFSVLICHNLYIFSNSAVGKRLGLNFFFTSCEIRNWQQCCVVSTRFNSLHEIYVIVRYFRLVLHCVIQL